MKVKENLADIQTSIKQACAKVGRNPEDITIIGVTKYVTVERAEEALEAGISNFGENRLEGFLEKYETIKDKATWHFIGSLQSRKVRDMVQQIDYIHSLDRRSLAKEINKRVDGTVSCFVQVNVSGEESKHGIKPEETEAFIESLADYSNIQIVGLMTMAPHVEEEQVLRDTFRELKELKDRIAEKNLAHAPCSYLSMGMSNDFPIAIEEGATHIRIGSKLVG